MYLTKVQYRLATIASILGIVEGTVWVILSLICISIHLSDENKELLDDSGHMTRVNYYMFIYFLHNQKVNANTIINPDSFHAFMWMYLVMDILWILASVFLIRFINWKKKVSPAITFICWTVITIIISLLDLILVILIGVDYDINCMAWLHGKASNYSIEEICTDVLIPVLIIAAKGFILWIINLIFAYLSYNILKSVRVGTLVQRGLLFSKIPRATLKSSSTPYTVRDEINKNKADDRFQSYIQSPSPQLQQKDQNGISNVWNNNSRSAFSNDRMNSHNFTKQQSFVGY